MSIRRKYAVGAAFAAMTMLETLANAAISLHTSQLEFWPHRQRSVHYGAPPVVLMLRETR